ASPDAIILAQSALAWPLAVCTSNALASPLNIAASSCGSLTATLEALSSTALDMPSTELKSAGYLNARRNAPCPPPEKAIIARPSRLACVRVIGRKNMRLRSWLGVMLMSAALAVNAGAWAQSYPDRPVRMLIAFPGGGTIDTLGRILAQKLTEAWGQNVVIENRPGAGGNIGAAAAAKAAPDGYTLHFGAQTLAVNVTLQPSKDFDPVKDFDPIMLVATAQDVLVVPPNSPFHSVKELIDYAKAHPGELNYASLGTG